LRGLGPFNKFKFNGKYKKNEGNGLYIDLDIQDAFLSGKTIETVFHIKGRLHFDKGIEAVLTDKESARIIFKKINGIPVSIEKPFYF